MHGLSVLMTKSDLADEVKGKSRFVQINDYSNVPSQ